MGMSVPLPPKWVRRVLIVPVVWFIAVWLLVAVIPGIVAIVAIVSFALPGRLRVLRLVGFFLVGMVVEVIGLAIAFITWVLSGFGYAMYRPTFLGINYSVVKGSLGVLFWFGCRYFELKVDGEGPRLPGDDGDPTTREYPLLVMSRHAGPGDSFLLVHELLSWAGRRPRIVLKDTLQWDPFIDIYLNRLPMRFVDPTSSTQGTTLNAISRLASTMAPQDALLIFPEGGNVTPGRRTRAIERLRESGRHAAADRAEGITHLMPPRPGGVHAALQANPDLQVLVVAHTGLDHLNALADIWHEIPLRKTLHLRWHAVPSSEIPHDLDGLSDWLFTEWELMDLWVDDHHDSNDDGAAAPTTDA
jgi:1-acyl-sn-glycerol-3-phosphate acyltransferase